jgi:hypothetical protein
MIQLFRVRAGQVLLCQRRGLRYLATVKAVTTLKGVPVAVTWGRLRFRLDTGFEIPWQRGWIVARLKPKDVPNQSALFSWNEREQVEPEVEPEDEQE